MIARELLPFSQELPARKVVAGGLGQTRRTRRPPPSRAVRAEEVVAKCQVGRMAAGKT